MGLDVVFWLYSVCNTDSRCRRVCGYGWRYLSALPNYSNKCSVGLRSDENASHGRVLMSCWRKKAVGRRTGWGHALSCWNWVTSQWTEKNGKTTGRRNSVMYYCAMRVPSMVIKGARWHLSESGTRMWIELHVPRPLLLNDRWLRWVHCNGFYRMLTVKLLPLKRSSSIKPHRSKPTSHCWRRYILTDYTLHILCC